MDLKNAAGVVLLSITVVACGGGGGSAPPPTGGDGTTPPAPVTPPPPPPPTYSTFAQLTGDQQFKSACGGLYNLQGQVGSDGFGRFPELAFTLSHDYAAASQTWTLTGQSRGGDRIEFSFGPGDTVTTSIPNTVAYAKRDTIGFTNRFFVGAPTLGGTVAEYLRGTASFLRTSGGTTFQNCVIGVPTLLTDRPTSTVSYANFSINGNVFIANPAGQPRQFDLGLSTATLSANPTTGTIDMRVTLTGREFQPDGSLSATPTQFGTFGGPAQIDGSVQAFSAPFNRLPDNSVGGSYSGWFFGPKGREAGLAFTYVGLAADGTNISTYGTIFAR